MEKRITEISLLMNIVAVNLRGQPIRIFLGRKTDNTKTRKEKSQKRGFYVRFPTTLQRGDNEIATFNNFYEYEILLKKVKLKYKKYLTDNYDGIDVEVEVLLPAMFSHVILFAYLLIYFCKLDFSL